MNEEIDRLPPHSIETEQALLGAILLSNGDSLNDCIKLLRDGPRMFFDLRHQHIYSAMLQMQADQQQVDVVTLYQKLGATNRLAESGGLPYLSGLPENCPSALNAATYCDTLTQLYSLRQLISVCARSVCRAFSQQDQSSEILDHAERDILSIRQFQRGSDARHVKDILPAVIQSIEDSFNAQGSPTGLATGLLDLDRLTGGLKPGDVFIVAGRPSTGKTALAVQVACHVAKTDKVPAAIFSLEMCAESLVLRQLCGEAHVNLRSVDSGNLRERDFPRLTHAAGTLQRSPVYIDDEGGITVSQICAKARILRQKFNVGLFVVDYLQLIQTGNRRDSRQQQITEISLSLKNLAKELRVPFIVLSQLNRDSERENRKPVLSDLRESGSIEQDADIVGMLYKPENKEQNEESEPVTLKIAKHRNGPTGEINLRFLRPYTRFESVSRVSEDSIPTKSPYKDD